MKPILFNSDMVRALLDGNKTVTRRAVKPQPRNDVGYNGDYYFEKVSSFMGWFASQIAQPYRPGDILYVRETWDFRPDNKLGYIYRADYVGPYEIKWHPSIHMPREAARIFLRVTNVRVEQLQDMTINDSLREGVKLNAKECVAGKPPLNPFARLWDSTIKPADRALYGWEANPYVWVIEFERCNKPEGWPT